jgi:hypothetical protein
MNEAEKEALRMFLKTTPAVQKMGRYQYRIDDRQVDFSSVIPMLSSRWNIPVWLAKNLGFLKIIWTQALPAILNSRA